MTLEEALPKAYKIQKELAPFCVRLPEIVGSVRRQKPFDIKDIEILCIPKLEVVSDMFGAPLQPVSLLQSAIPSLLREWRATTTRNGEKWKTIIFPDATKLDLFVVTAETYGTQMVIKTGPADYSHWVVTTKRNGGAFPSYARFDGGFNIYVGDRNIPMPGESDFFKFLEISPVPHPSERVAGWK